MRRMLITNILVILAVLAVGGIIGWLIYNNYYYYSTDDAQVTGTIINISSPAAGTLETLNVKVGDKVTNGQTIGTLSTTTATGASNTVNLTSPMTGVVIAVSAVPGQIVAPGLPIAQETDPSSVTITAYVDEGQLNNIMANQNDQVDIHVDAYSDTSFTGHVNQIVNAAASEFSLLPTQDNASGNFTKVGQRIPVIITLDGNAGKLLLPGMSAEVTIHLH
jgi:multidrug resistance efflux pump